MLCISEHYAILLDNNLHFQRTCYLTTFIGRLNFSKYSVTSIVLVLVLFETYRFSKKNYICLRYIVVRVGNLHSEKYITLLQDKLLQGGQNLSYFFQSIIISSKPNYRWKWDIERLRLNAKNVFSIEGEGAVKVEHTLQ